MTACRICTLSHTKSDPVTSGDPRHGSPIIAAIDAHGSAALYTAAARIALGGPTPGPRARSAALWAALEACGMGDMDALWSPRYVQGAVDAWASGHAAEIHGGDIAYYIAVREALDVQAVADELDALWRHPALSAPGAWKSGWQRWPGGVRIVSGQTWPDAPTAPGPFFDADDASSYGLIAGVAEALTFGRGTLLSIDAPPAIVAVLLYKYGVTPAALWDAAARGAAMRRPARAE